MTLSSTGSRVSYAGNGSTTVFSFPYYFLADAHLVVVSRNSTTGVETTKTITTHYTVSGSGESAGGSVTMLVAPATGTTLIIYRNPTLTQGLDLVENDALPAEDVEEALDKLTMLVQRLGDRVDRSVRLTDGFSPTFTNTLPVDLDDAADKVPLINATGDGWADAADWPTADDVADAEENAAAAATSAAAAATSATASATSATASATSATAAQTAETNAETAEANAETAETNAETAEANAETAETNAETAQAAAETAQAAAATSATASAASATAAAGSATSASTSASNASTSATNAATSASSASTSASAAAASEAVVVASAAGIRTNTVFNFNTFS